MYPRSGQMTSLCPSPRKETSPNGDVSFLMGIAVLDVVGRGGCEGIGKAARPH